MYGPKYEHLERKFALQYHHSSAVGLSQHTVLWPVVAMGSRGAVGSKPVFNFYLSCDINLQARGSGQAQGVVVHPCCHRAAWWQA